MQVRSPFWEERMQMPRTRQGPPISRCKRVAPPLRSQAPGLYLLPLRWCCSHFGWFAAARAAPLLDHADEPVTIAAGVCFTNSQLALEAGCGHILHAALRAGTYCC